MSSPGTPDLRQFVVDLIDAAGWPEGGDIDAFEFQELCVKHGVLVEETRHAPCGESCFCSGYYDPDEFKDGVRCYRKAEWL